MKKNYLKGLTLSSFGGLLSIGGSSLIMFNVSNLVCFSMIGLGLVLIIIGIIVLAINLAKK